MSIFLILVLAILLIGCGKKSEKDTSKHTSLEGTWKVTERIFAVDGEIHQELKYPSETELAGMKFVIQPYYQLNNNKAMYIEKQIIQYGDVEEESFVIKTYDCSVSGNTITLIEEYNGDTFEEVYNYVINGTSMTWTTEQNEHNTITYKLIKVPDSEVDGWDR